VRVVVNSLDRIPSCKNTGIVTLEKTVNTANIPETILNYDMDSVSADRDVNVKLYFYRVRQGYKTKVSNEFPINFTDCTDKRAKL